MSSRDHRPLRRHESGFTLVEIIIAISVLMVGVLGTTTMANISNKTTVTANSRQGGTSLVRRALETARALPFQTIRGATLAADMQAQSPDLATTATGSWQVRRDGYLYTLDASVCRVDDDSDGYGTHDNVDPAFCADNTTTGTADEQAGDYKRVTVTATWTVGGETRAIRQVTLVPPGGMGDAPAVADVRPTSPAATPGQPLVITTQPSPSSLTFSATTTNMPGSVSWLIDGTEAATCPPVSSACSGSANFWWFTWVPRAPTIDTASGSPNQDMCVAPTGSSSYVFDGTYQVGALPLYDNGQAGTGASTPVTLNRCTPIQPPNFNATGRDNLQTGPVDIQWDANPEGDIGGYKVYRGTSTSSMGSSICPPNASDPPIEDLRSCVDANPPSYNNSPLYYGVYAYDQSPTGNVRRGALAFLDVNGANAAPKGPTNLAAVVSGNDVTVDWKTPSSPSDPDPGDSVESFRVYRRGAGVPSATPWTTADRIGPAGYDSVRAFCSGSTAPGASCGYTDAATDGAQHQYMVTSVDSHLRESVYITVAAPSA